MELALFATGAFVAPVAVPVAETEERERRARTARYGSGGRALAARLAAG